MAPSVAIMPVAQGDGTSGATPIPSSTRNFWPGFLGYLQDVHDIRAGEKQWQFAKAVLGSWRPATCRGTAIPASSPAVPRLLRAAVAAVPPYTILPEWGVYSIACGYIDMFSCVAELLNGRHVGGSEVLPERAEAVSRRFGVPCDGDFTALSDGRLIEIGKVCDCLAISLSCKDWSTLKLVPWQLQRGRTAELWRDLDRWFHLVRPRAVVFENVEGSWARRVRGEASLRGTGMRGRRWR